MPERKLEVVLSRDGQDSVVSTVPLAPKDTVRLHQPDPDTYRVVARHPRDAYDKIEREVSPGTFEVVSGPAVEDVQAEIAKNVKVDDAENAKIAKETEAVDSPTAGSAVAAPEEAPKPARKTTRRKTTAKK